MEVVEKDRGASSSAEVNQAQAQHRKTEKAKYSWHRRNKSKEKGEATLKIAEAAGADKSQKILPVPPLGSCFAPGSSILKEVKERDARIVADVFAKTQGQILGKRGDDDPDGVRIANGREKRCKYGSGGAGQSNAGEGGGTLEATGHGAAGHLTGAEEGVCQEK